MGQVVEFVETPAERFEGLRDYPWAPRYVEVDPSGMRMHYVEAGPADGPVVLLLHGEPSWSYLYRHMIPVFAESGHRVVAPDLIGFGRSSKPTKVTDHSYAAHVAWVRGFLEALELTDITLFAQDWGSLIGLRLVAETDRFARVAIGNGFLPKADKPEISLKTIGNIAAFMGWRTFARFTPRFVCSKVLQMGTGRTLKADELHAYDAPFPDRRFLAGPRAMPQLVPLTPKDPARADQLAAWEKLERWDKPFLTLFSTGDPIMRGLDRVLQKAIPGTQGQPHQRVRGGHFLQEDSGPELAAHVIQLIQRG
ncbi:MAG: haloalkane dehalogenase [Deltaproteobacteria bacterium]|nr:haloalkane dehalogenase [Deltaproteobacteria bacterium]